MGNCAASRHRKLDLQMELTYVADGGGPMVCMYYDGDPPENSVGDILWCARKKFQEGEEAGVEVHLWNVSICCMDDWREGLGIFGVKPGCELPTVVLHAPGRTYRQPIATLEGNEDTQPLEVLEAMRRSWPRELSDRLWGELESVLGAGAIGHK
mmetsp:Transcript_70531/g.163003  ORF Transcript_70531/g.163003 Transcript_70531/m.163003 type:complete len:154 (-) Transcript_70531:229-690(-)